MSYRRAESSGSVTKIPIKFISREWCYFFDGSFRQLGICWRLVGCAWLSDAGDGAGAEQPQSQQTDAALQGAHGHANDSSRHCHAQLSESAEIW